MGEILALGISHYPPLASGDERMAGILRYMLKNPNLTEDRRDPASWPQPMRDEWGEDSGESAAARHRSDLRAWLERARDALDAFDPDFILVWGDDQYENFKEDIIPPYCVYAHPAFTFSPPKHNVWNEDPESRVTLNGHAKAGKYLVSRLIAEGFDAAYSYKPLHHDLGHAFANAVFYLDYDRQGFGYPILPFSINCYGRHVICQRGGFPDFGKALAEGDLDPPGPTPARLFDLGAAVGRILSASPWRVALLASSSWSHAFLTAKNDYLYPDLEADRYLFSALRAGDYHAWRSYPAEAIEACGQQEVLNWMCLAGALRELGRGPGETGLVETWIFNSSKAFLISPPAC